MLRPIDCSWLYKKSKKSLQEGSGTYSDIIDIIYADYKSQESGEQMHDGQWTASRTQLRRAGTSLAIQQHANPTKVSVAHGLPRFPINKGS